MRMPELSLKYSSGNYNMAQRGTCFLPTEKLSWILMVCIANSSTKRYLNLCIGGHHVLRVHLCADEVVLVSIDVRTGRMNLRDTGDLAAASRGPRFAIISDRLNDNPGMLQEALVRLRLNVSHKSVSCEIFLCPCRQSWTSSSRRRATSASKSSSTAISRRKVCDAPFSTSPIYTRIQSHKNWVYWQEA